MLGHTGSGRRVRHAGQMKPFLQRVNPDRRALVESNLIGDA